MTANQTPSIVPHARNRVERSKDQPVEVLMISNANKASTQITSPVATTGEQIVEMAEKTLRGSSYWPLRQVRCSYDEGQLTLHGKVPSFYLKQVAQSAIRKVEKSVQIDNRLEVDEGESRQ